MNKIEKGFHHGKALITFVTGGDPDLETTERLIYKMQEGGADVIEIGIPFSDPIAEGPIIQKANERALRGGCTTDKLFAKIEKMKKNVKVPLVFLTYFNSIYTYGTEKFMRKCVKSGISGLIVPDLPYEEQVEILPICEQNGLYLISLIAPTSQERIQKIVKRAKGFLYCVSSLGVTGVRKEISTDIKSIVKIVKDLSPLPCAVGFGISTPKQGRELAEVCDGIIVGSSIVEIVEKYGKESEQPVYEFVKTMKGTIRNTSC